MANVTGNDLPGSLPTTPPTWSKDGCTLYFHVSRHGSTILKSLTLDGNLQTVIDDTGSVGTFNFDEAQSKLACLHGNMTNLAQVWVRDVPTGRSRKLTRVNENLLQARDLGEIEEV